MDPDTSAVKSVIALQYNPDSLSRTLQIQAVQGGQDGTRVDALRLRGPAVETIKIDAELDATDQLELPDAVSARGATRSASATGATGDAGQSHGRDPDGRRQHGQRRHAGDHSAGTAAHVVRLEQDAASFRCG